MNRFVLKNIFIKVYVYHFSINIFLNKISKLCFGDRVAVLNDFLYQYGGSIYSFNADICIYNCTNTSERNLAWIGIGEKYVTITNWS